MKFRAAVLRALAVSLFVFTGVVACVQPATASVACDSGFGSKVPVLFVHGFDSRPSMWDKGQPSMIELVKKIDGVKVVKAFDYEAHHFDWVTDDAIGLRLAQTIDCLAQNSLKSGGAGKVIIVAHSMGGLAARYAASLPIDGRRVADEIGLVITLGTPHLGSPLATVGGDLPRAYCRLLVDEKYMDDRVREVQRCWESEALTGLMVGSSQLAKLPSFPAGLPVRAIAGNVTLYYQYIDSSAYAVLQSDMVVPVDSATAEYTNYGRGDGRFVFGCDLRHYDMYGSSSIVPSVNGGQCTHNEMYKTGYVQQSVVNGINECLASDLVPVPDFSHLTNGRTTVLDKLSIPMPGGWQLSFAKPGKFVNFADDTVCNESASACPHVNFINVTTSNTADNLMKLWTNGTSPCVTGTLGTIEGPAITYVGGQSAQLYRQYCGTLPRYMWIVAGRLFVCNDERSDATIIQAVLERATWV